MKEHDVGPLPHRLHVEGEAGRLDKAAHLAVRPVAAVGGEVGFLAIDQALLREGVRLGTPCCLRSRLGKRLGRRIAQRALLALASAAMSPGPA